MDVPRDDTFAALALGLRAGSISPADALRCLSDLRHDVATTTTTRRDVRLNENTVLLAIAYANALGTSPSLAGVDEGSTTTTVRTRIDQDSNLASNALVLALASK